VDWRAEPLRATGHHWEPPPRPSMVGTVTPRRKWKELTRHGRGGRGTEDHQRIRRRITTCTRTGQDRTGLDWTGLSPLRVQSADRRVQTAVSDQSAAVRPSCSAVLQLLDQTVLGGGLRTVQDWITGSCTLYCPVSMTGVLSNGPTRVSCISTLSECFCLSHWAFQRDVAWRWPGLPA
jgi:hypothetical protein